MTQFKKAQFIYEGGYLSYALSTMPPMRNADGNGTTTLLDRSNTKFIARFKYCARDKAGFQAFLIKNFTVEEYFGRDGDCSPVKMLEAKGYISATVRQILKRTDYPQTTQGYKDYITDQVNKTIHKYSMAEVA